VRGRGHGSDQASTQVCHLATVARIVKEGTRSKLRGMVNVRGASGEERIEYTTRTEIRSASYGEPLVGSTDSRRTRKPRSRPT